MFGNALQFIHKLIVQYCESPVSSPITWCLGIIWIIKSIHALYKMKVKTDELVAEKEAKEVSEAIKDLDTKRLQLYMKNVYQTYDLQGKAGSNNAQT